MKRRPAALLALAAALLLAACEEAPRSDGESGAHPSRAISTSSTDADGSSDPTVITEGIGSGPEWRLVHDWARNDPAAGFGLASESLTVIHQHSPDGDVLRVEDRLGVNVLVQEAKPEWMIQETWISAHYVLAEYSNLAEDQISLDAFKIEGGEVTHLDMSNTNRRYLGPELAFFGDRIAWASGVPDDHMCVGVTDLVADEARTLECVAPGLIIGDLALDGDTVVFSVLSKPRSFERRCKSIMIINLQGRHDRTAEREIASRSDCDAWNAVPLPGGVAWDVTDPNMGDIMNADGFAWLEGHTYALGRIYTDSEVVCGGRLFWTDAVNEATTPFMWDLKSPTFQRALDFPDDKSQSATALKCADDRFVSTRLEDIGGRNEHLRLFALDTRELQ
ncbi:hypothetical protein F0U44_12050 [Nocardioides humilatus]|uniref:Uncharacterized protein n=1 Tax=Nocardioides humilatus TaxID=2607660 RepID=A0A5B1LHT8_9ACTN|nr:hypothetical protein [Nocardioides humilatus]KAA1419177.1 hypothetical protein F0U44_12050 [Nocardioides humilatus]